MTKKILNKWTIVILVSFALLSFLSWLFWPKWWKTEIVNLKPGSSYVMVTKINKITGCRNTYTNVRTGDEHNSKLRGCWFNTRIQNENRRSQNWEKRYKLENKVRQGPSVANFIFLAVIFVLTVWLFAFTITTIINKKAPLVRRIGATLLIIAYVVVAFMIWIWSQKMI